MPCNGSYYRPRGKVMFSQVSVCPQSASWLLVHCSTFLQHGRYASYWNAFFLLPPATKLGQGYILICDSVHGGGSASVHAGIPPPSKADPLTSRPPGKQTPLARQTPPSKETPLHSACWEIRSTSGRYASY